MPSEIKEIGLAKGLALALAQLRIHQRDGMRVNLNAVRKDKTFIVFLALSCAGFYRIASREFGELSRERRAAAKLARTRSAQGNGSAVSKVGRLVADEDFIYILHFFSIRGTEL